ncbi:MAG: polysaccharide deacetylase family protein [Acutalibacteraceae bacterium]
MKRSIISIFLAFSLIFSFCTFCLNVQAAESTTDIVGDVNNDSKINVLDLVAMRKYLAKWNVTINETNADLNFDKNVNLLDIIVLRKGLVGIINFEDLKPPKYIALTFDDGPNTYATPDILTQLKLNKVPATFFLIGGNINDSTLSIVEREINAGHEIANHSFSHSNMASMEPEKIKEEVAKTDDILYEKFGITTNFFRPPFLGVSDTMHDNIDKTFIAGLDSTDWSNDVTADQVAENIMKKATDGTIILLHDSQSKNANVLRKIIPYLKEQGFTFVTMSDLFKLTDVTPEKYITYSNVYN